METKAADSAAVALESRCALSEESRLDIFRVLVQNGGGGFAAGSIAGHCKVPAPTCSFHLKELTKGGLLSCCRHGRSQIYTANFGAIRALLGYLTEHCCSEEECDHEGPSAAESRQPGSGRGPGAGWPLPARTVLANKG